MSRITAAFVLLLMLFGCESADRPDIALPDASQKSLANGVPLLEVTIPIPSGLNAAQVPPISTYEWQTAAGSTDPDYVRWILVSVAQFDNDWSEAMDYIRTNPDAEEWYPWVAYDPSSEESTSWTTPPVDFGRYLFAVHGKDADGTVDEEFVLERNVRRILVGPRTSGPIVRLTSDFMDPVLSASPTTPPTVVVLPAGTPASFCWTGDASAYGGVVRSYRYGWDILDLADDSQWDVGYTPSDGSEECSAPRIFFFGTHTFYVDVVDNNDYFTRIPIMINFTPPPITLSLDIRPGTCQNPLNPKSKGVLWVALLGSYNFDVTGVDMSTLHLREYRSSGEGVKPGRSKVEDVMTAPNSPVACACPTEGPDGFDDLSLKFSTVNVGQTIASTHIGDEVKLELVGLLNDGTPFLAVDCVRIVGIDTGDEEPPPPGPDTEIFAVMNTYWVDNQEFQELIDINDAVRDTVPYGSWITMFYYGSPYPSGTSFCTDPVNECITYQKNFTWSSARFPGVGGSTSWLPVPPEDNNPFGTPDSTSMNMGSVEYTVRVRSVDEFDVPDATPAGFPIIGNLQPTLDDHAIENHDGTAVGDGETVMWDWWNPANYHGSIADTLDLSDPPNVWVLKEWHFLIKAHGHDHAKEGSNAGVKSWFYQFRRSNDPSFIQPFANSGLWTDAVTVNSVCDTVTLTVRYPFFDAGAEQTAWENLPDWLNRGYDLSIRGRDTRSTDEFDQYMYVRRERTLINRYSTGMLGRETEVGTMSFDLTIVR
jgi:hypothetical protein